MSIKKVFRFFNKAEDIVISIFFILLFLVGLYGLYDSYLIYQEANDTSLLKFKPGYSSEEPDKPIKGNMVAWITLDGTGIDYPVMQGDTNSEYLNKNPYGEYSMSGSIFLDSRNSPDFSDSYSLIYGHHMENSMMFGALDDYLDKDYFDAHKDGALIVGDQKYPIRIFAVVEAEATNEYIFAPTETDAVATLKYVKKNAVFWDKQANTGNGESILGMSTCKYPDTVERTIVFGILQTRRRSNAD